MQGSFDEVRAQLHAVAALNNVEFSPSSLGS